MKKLFRKKRGVRKTSKAGKKRVSKTSDKHIAKICKSVITRQAEKKVFNYTFAANSAMGIWGGGQFAALGITPLSPYTGFTDIVLGTASNQRLGNQITIQSTKLKLMFTPFPYNSVQNPTPSLLLVSVILYYERAQPNTYNVALPGLFQNGSSSSDPSSTGLAYDTMKPFNNDRYKVFRRKTFKLGYASVSTGANADYANNSNNDFKECCKVSMDVTKYLIKKQRYDDATANPIGSRGLYMAVLIQGADGRALSNVYRYAYMNGTIETKFTDF